MPVLVDRGGQRGSGGAGRGGNARDLEIAFVNNMPDPALEATERHFLKLLEAAAGDYLVRVTPDCHPVTAHAFGSRIRASNDVPEPALMTAGYKVLARSAEAGVDLFIKQGRTLSVFFQGHPEYQPDTLLREYRRDVGRFLRGEQAAHPALPASCLPEDTARALLRFRDRAVGERRAALIDEFPAVLPAARWTQCQPLTITIYRNWLSFVSEQKTSLAGSGRAHRLDVSSAP